MKKLNIETKKELSIKVHEGKHNHIIASKI